MRFVERGASDDLLEASGRQDRRISRSDRIAPGRKPGRRTATLNVAETTRGCVPTNGSTARATPPASSSRSGSNGWMRPLSRRATTDCVASLMRAAIRGSLDAVRRRPALHGQTPSLRSGEKTSLYFTGYSTQNKPPAESSQRSTPLQRTRRGAPPHVRRASWRRGYLLLCRRADLSRRRSTGRSRDPTGHRRAARLRRASSLICFSAGDTRERLGLERAQSKPCCVLHHAE